MKQNWKEKKINLGNAIIIAAVTLILGLGIGANFKYFKKQFGPYLGTQKSTSSLDWQDLDRVYEELSANYDGTIDESKLIEGAKKGLVESLGDEYTAYMDAPTTKKFQASLHGKVGAGVGIEMAMRGKYVRIVRTLPNNPARKAGILAGDIIYKVNDEEVWNKKVDTIATKIRGQAGTKVKLTIVRNDKTYDFELTREEINNVSADVTYDGKTAIIMVTRFDNDTGALVQNFAKEFAEKGIDKVILDLRGNGGGYVSAARDLLSLWIDGQKVLVQRSKNNGENTIYANRGQAILANTKTVVLVNGTSASASEIVTGALQNYKKATIVGEKTFGKGVVQTMLDLDAGTMLKVTTAHWYTPNGSSINHKGITPDQKVKRSFDDINSDRDPQMDAAKKL